jgi:hypothetical protein
MPDADTKLDMSTGLVTKRGRSYNVNQATISRLTV